MPICIYRGGGTLKAVTTDNTVTQLFLDGIHGRNVDVVEPKRDEIDVIGVIVTPEPNYGFCQNAPKDAMGFHIYIVGKERGSANAVFADVRAIAVVGSDGVVSINYKTTALDGLGNPTYDVILGGVSWDFNVSIVQNNKMKITVTGGNGRTIDWKATFGTGV